MEESDRELLERAAKAIGVNVAQGGRIAINGRIWDPLADDGDALRLAVKLRFLVDVRLGDKTYVAADDHKATATMEQHGDADAATRRAIVRAAAELGGKNA